MAQHRLTRPPGARVSRLTAFAALFLLAILLGALPALAQATSPYGVNVHAPTGADLTAKLDRVRAAGIGWIRVDFLWPAIEAEPGVFDWSAYDEIAAAASARHLGVLATVLFTPDWATSAPSWTGVPDVAAWTDFCRRAAERYRGKIDHWEIWNEPNLSEFWAGSRQQYIDVLLKPGSDALHAGNPDAQVGGPALAHLVSADWFDWLSDVLSQAGDRLDFITHHVYNGSGNRQVTSKLNDSTLFGDQPGLWSVVAPSVREVLEHEHRFGGPFWLTETGWQSAAVGESHQAGYYSGILGDWFTGQHRQDWITRLFFYELQDPDPSTGLSWGMLAADGTPKAAYSAYRDFIAAHPPPAPPPPQLHDGATLVAADVPATMEAGQTISVSLTFRNSGTTAWTAASGYKLGAPGDTDPFAPARQLLAAGEVVSPGAQRTFTFDFTAPATAGSYTTRWQMLREGVAWFGDEVTRTVTVATAPSAAARTLSLLGGRFAVGVSWFDSRNGNAGFGRAVPGSDESGSFWFFSPANLELVVKALDGRPVNAHYWLFYGALSNVEYWVAGDRPHDRRRPHLPQPLRQPLRGWRHLGLRGRRGRQAGAGAVRGRGAGGLAGRGRGRLVGGAAGAGERAGCRRERTREHAPSGCVPSAEDLCLLGSRFRVSVRWRIPQGATGPGGALPVTDETGTFWFFEPANVELMVKVLDGRAISGKYWFFYGARCRTCSTISWSPTR